jgi:ankyrin repeat protein
MKTSFRALIISLAMTASSSAVLAGAYDDLIAAVYRDDTNAVMDLVNRGMDVNSVDPAGNTLLHIAARNGNGKLLTELLKQKANANARSRVGDTPLMLAAYNDQREAVDALLAGGAQLNHEGWTPLHYAAFANMPDMVAHLLKKGAAVDALAPNGQTALMLAARNGNAPIAKLLLDAKADSSLKDQHGETAITLAEKNNNNVVAELIKMPNSASRLTPSQAKDATPSQTQKAAPAIIPATAPAPAQKSATNEGEYISPPFQTEK